MVILGGIGNVYGVIVGAILIGSFDRILAEELTKPLNGFGEAIGVDWLANHSVTSDRFLVFGLALVLMMLFRPGGLFPSARRKAETAPEMTKSIARRHENIQLYDTMESDDASRREQGLMAVQVAPNLQPTPVAERQSRSKREASPSDSAA